MIDFIRGKTSAGKGWSRAPRDVVSHPARSFVRGPAGADTRQPKTHANVHGMRMVWDVFFFFLFFIVVVRGVGDGRGSCGARQLT